MSAKYTANDISAYFINKANSIEIDDGVVEGIGNLKLQKILYFSQAASLSLNNKALFDEKIEAWRYGPVVSDIYHLYKDHSNNPIASPKDPFKSLDADTADLLDKIWEIFGKFSAGQLVDLSHNHAPWKDANKKGSNTEITHSALKTFYKGVFVAN